MTIAQNNIRTETRLVVINFPDSIIHARVLISRPDIKPDYTKMYHWYTPDCIKKNMGGFSGYLLHGDYRVYDNQNHLILLGAFSKGLKTGAWKKWYPNGNLSELTVWEDGFLNGLSVLFDHDGRIIREDKFRKGELIEKKTVRKKKKGNQGVQESDTMSVPIDSLVRKSHE